MIIINSTVGKQMKGGKWTHRTPAKIVKLPPPEETNTLSCLYNCEKKHYTFHGDNEYESDKFSLFSQISTPHSTVFVLIKNSIEYILEDDTYGELITHDSNTIQYIVDWKKVFDVLGNGIYKLKKVETAIGRVYTNEYGNFHLIPFNERLANDTIRITTYQNGSIENLYDYKNYNVFNQIRLKGELINEAIVSEVLSNQSRKREDVQVHDRDFCEYDLKLIGLEDQAFKALKNEHLMADIIEIDTYAMFKRRYKKLLVRKKSIEIDFDSLLHTDMTIKVEDYIKDRIKHSI